MSKIVKITNNRRGQHIRSCLIDLHFAKFAGFEGNVHTIMLLMGHLNSAHELEREEGFEKCGKGTSWGSQRVHSFSIRQS